MTLIKHVVIYKGHPSHPAFGPYPANVNKRVQMFEILNSYRAKIHRPKWQVYSFFGEELAGQLKNFAPQETLLVIPAGQSSHLDLVFPQQDLEFLKHEFLEKGGRGYFNCGSAYWVSQKRIYHDLCTENPENRATLVKGTHLPLFAGIAEGPLCPFPGKKYRVGFFSDAVTVTNGEKNCTIYLSGGGSFQVEQVAQKVKVLVKYLRSELVRQGKHEKEVSQWENAAILASVKKGAVLLSMFHPYYGPNDIDVETYEKVFPDCGTDWGRVKNNLSSEEERMDFVLNSMLLPLEDHTFIL